MRNGIFEKGKHFRFLQKRPNKKEHDDKIFKYYSVSYFFAHQQISVMYGNL